MIAEHNSLLYDQPTRTFYAAIDPDCVGPHPTMIQVPSKHNRSYHVTFYMNNERSTGVGFADVYETREPNAMPYYILLYKDADLMRQHWRIARRAHD